MTTNSDEQKQSHETEPQPPSPITNPVDQMISNLQAIMDKGFSDEEKAKQLSANLRTEYTEMSRHRNVIVNFRITLLGFYLAAVAWLVQSAEIGRNVSIIGLGFTIILALFEWRTGIVYRDLAYRGSVIEEIWGLRDRSIQSRKAQPHYSRLHPKAGPARLSHTNILRILYGFTGGYFTLALIVSVFAQ